MPKLRKMNAVDADYPFSGPNSTTIRQVINKPARSVFTSLEDGPAWKEWLGIDVEWTSDKPFGVGTTRTVTANGQQFDEYFVVWEEPLRMGFYFERGTLPLSAFAEDYTLTPLSDSSCELAWTFAFEWGGPLPIVLGRLFGMFFAFNGKRSLKSLAKMMESTNRFD
ncbi:MAG: SRPBCC family protein [Chloroflexota bacterium]